MQNRVSEEAVLAFAAIVALCFLGLVLQRVGLHDERFAAILLATITGFVVRALLRSREYVETARLRVRPILMLAGAVLIAIQLGFFVMAVIHPSLSLDAKATLAAARVMAAGDNPYTHPVDLTHPGELIYQGYKFLPILAGAYIPLGLLFGQTGYLLTNLLLQGGVAYMVFRLASHERDPEQGILPVVVYLALPLVAVEAFGRGAPDLVPVLLSLIAVELADRDPFFGGLACGLSLSAKLLPGAAILPCTVPSAPEARGKFLVGLLLGLVPSFLYLGSAPRAFLLNVFDLSMRAGDQFGPLGDAPAIVMFGAQAVIAALWLGVASFVWRQPMLVEQRCGLAAILLLTAILVLPVSHGSDHLWWIPLAAIVISRPAVVELLRAPVSERLEANLRTAEDRQRQRLGRLTGQARDEPKP